jgi:hypothetical protein
MIVHKADSSFSRLQYKVAALWLEYRAPASSQSRMASRT